MPILIPEVQNASPEPTKKERSGAPAVSNSLKPIAVKSRRVQFGSPDSEPVPVPIVKKDKSAKPKREKVKADPVHVAAARELRDRWLERVKADPSILLSSGKYDVSKELTAPLSKEILQLPALPAPLAA